MLISNPPCPSNSKVLAQSTVFFLLPLSMPLELPPTGMVGELGLLSQRKGRKNATHTPYEACEPYLFLVNFLNPNPNLSSF